jgi:hypothetical protein
MVGPTQNESARGRSASVDATAATQASADCAFEVRLLALETRPEAPYRNFDEKGSQAEGYAHVKYLQAIDS